MPEKLPESLYHVRDEELRSLREEIELQRQLENDWRAQHPDLEPALMAYRAEVARKDELIRTARNPKPDNFQYIQKERNDRQKAFRPLDLADAHAALIPLATALDTTIDLIRPFEERGTPLMADERGFRQANQENEERLRRKAQHMVDLHTGDTIFTRLQIVQNLTAAIARYKGHNPAQIHEHFLGPMPPNESEPT